MAFRARKVVGFFREMGPREQNQLVVTAGLELGINGARTSRRHCIGQNEVEKKD